MLRAFILKNFRCFQSFTLENLERVNLIGGKNNVGKTSLLEALFIFINPSHPESLLQVNRIWDISRYKLGKFEDIEELRGFFFDQDMNKVIKIIGVNEKNIKNSLNIRLLESEREILFSDNPEISRHYGTLTTEIRPYDTLVLEYQDLNNQSKKIQSSITLKADGNFVSMGYRRKEKFPVGIYLTTNIRSPQEDAERFSNLERVGRQDEVLETLRLLEPRLKRLSLLVMEREPIISGDIGMRELVPLPLMGEGIGRLLSIINVKLKYL